MNILALETSTSLMFLALGHAGRVWTHQGEGSAQASATLIPQIQNLLGQAGLKLRDLELIAVGRGPGSFTGVRTACAVAQGLALGINCKVLPVDTLLAVAESAHQATGAHRVSAVLDARMGEIYTASYEKTDGVWSQVVEPAINAPQSWAAPSPDFVLAGNLFSDESLESEVAQLDLCAWAGPTLGQIVVQQFTNQWGRPPVSVFAMPTAQALLRLAQCQVQHARGVPVEAVDPEQLAPLYLRDKVAQTTAERDAARQQEALR